MVVVLHELVHNSGAVQYVIYFLWDSVFCVFLGFLSKGLSLAVLVHNGFIQFLVNISIFDGNEEGRLLVLKLN